MSLNYTVGNQFPLVPKAYTGLSEGSSSSESSPYTSPSTSPDDPDVLNLKSEEGSLTEGPTATLLIQRESVTVKVEGVAKRKRRRHKRKRPTSQTNSMSTPNSGLPNSKKGADALIPLHPTLGAKPALAALWSRDLLDELEEDEFVGTVQKQESGIKQLQQINVKQSPDPDEWIVDQLFQCTFSQKNGTARRREWIKLMPKVELHLHATGAIHPRTCIELAIAKQLYFDPKTYLFSKENGQGKIPAGKLERFQEFVEEFENRACIRACVKGTQQGCDHFFKAFQYVWSVAQHLSLSERVGLVVEEAIQHNVKHIEPMFDLPIASLPIEFQQSFDPLKPENFSAALKILESDFWLEKEVAKHELMLKECNEEVAKKIGALTVTDPEGAIDVSYIIAIDRTLDDDQFFASMAAAMALVQKNPEIVGGVNIVGPEHSLFASNHFNTQMSILKFLGKVYDKANITLHAGEVSRKLVANFGNHISGSIEAGAKRVGHAVSLQYEKNSQALVAKMAREKILVEFCWSSNLTTLNIPAAEHPIHTYLASGVPIAICTDDSGVLCQTPTDEMLEVADTFELSYRQLKKITLDSAEAAFVPAKRKAKLVAAIALQFKRFEAHILEENIKEIRASKLATGLFESPKMIGMLLNTVAATSC